LRDFFLFSIDIKNSQEQSFRPAPAQEEGGSVPEWMTNDTAKQIALLYGRIVIGDNFHHDHPLRKEHPAIGK
jgi:hypothetical protein